MVANSLRWEVNASKLYNKGRLEAVGENIAGPEVVENTAGPT
jgi:hypothetical protein